MEKNILVINIGSTSKKYSFYHGERLLLCAHFEKNKDSFDVTYGESEVLKISSEVFTESLRSFRDSLYSGGLLDENNQLTAIGVRLVAPGIFFTEDRIVDEEFLRRLDEIALQDIAHIGHLQKELSIAREFFSGSVLVAISDSSFHKTLPALARNYAIPKDLTEEGVCRFGYHGISLASIVTKLHARPLGLEKRSIVCHLGGGASITALLDGKSVDTSMGYSPLEGLVMSSRVGNIDVGAVLALIDKKGVKELQNILYTKSGLLAISGLSDDMRTLLDAEQGGHVGAHDAIEVFVHSIRKYIGTYAAVLGGIDLIVFSGTIGERSFILRDRICRNFDWLNIHLDSEKNVHAKTGDYISKEGSVGVCVIHSDEDLEIMRRVHAWFVV